MLVFLLCLRKYWNLPKPIFYIILSLSFPQKAAKLFCHLRRLDLIIDIPQLKYCAKLQKIAIINDFDEIVDHFTDMRAIIKKNIAWNHNNTRSPEMMNIYSRIFKLAYKHTSVRVLTKMSRQVFLSDLTRTYIYKAVSDGNLLALQICKNNYRGPLTYKSLFDLAGDNWEILQYLIDTQYM